MLRSLLLGLSVVIICKFIPIYGALWLGYSRLFVTGSQLSVQDVDFHHFFKKKKLVSFFSVGTCEDLGPILGHLFLCR